MIYRRVNPEKLEAVRGNLDVTIRQAMLRIAEIGMPNVDCELCARGLMMISYNPANERIKRRYFTYLAEALAHSQQTVDAAAKAIARFEEYAGRRDFKKFHIQQAKGFKQHLSDQRAARSGNPLSKATLYATLAALKRYFIWLARRQPGQQISNPILRR